ncbi:hypothetical protein FACS1894167_04880 [Synergistales bacterium]|nr:hypothetical protein FACS1894167_04880 [Synergistales bacterium]
MMSENKEAREKILSCVEGMISEVLGSHGLSEGVLKPDCRMLDDMPCIHGQERFVCEITLSGAAIESAVSGYKESVGENRQDLRNTLWGKSDSWSFLWFLPKGLEREETENVDFTDINGQKWISPLRVLPPEKQESLLNKPVVLEKDVPDETAWRVVSHFWERAEFFWRRFCENITKNKEGGKTYLPYKALVKLEASLNAIWTSSKANKYMLRDLSDHGDVNKLLLMETKRGVNVAYKPKQAGRVRLPHLSHRGRLCPYHTPESKDIGLHLFRSAGSTYSPSEKKIKVKEREHLVSLAVGLIPYIEHSDGPRLLMGGKNLKQAEHGIKELCDENLPTARVPGYLESEIKNDETLGIENNRFKYPLGLDALVAVMPYKGFTYEDGLVVSRYFANKLSIPDGSRLQTEILKINLSNDEKLPTIEKMENELNERRDTPYSFNAALPLPQICEGKTPAPRYGCRYDGKLKSCEISVVPERKKSGPRGKAEKSEQDDKGGTFIRLKIRYEFSVERSLAVGDKLTGRHGNKGVVTHIMDKPATAVIVGRETPIDIDLMISPGALMGRKNLGQLYEMTHSLLLWGKEEEKLFDSPDYDEWREKLSCVERNKLLTHDQLADLLPVAKKMAGSEDGSFKILLPNGEGEYRAFVGFQHIARLHHHVRAKLQYRQKSGPFNSLLAQPGSGGGNAGQRLGEMENWSCLSHPIVGEKDSFNLLFSMRKEHGEASGTRELVRSILWSLGHRVGENAEIERLSAEKEAFYSAVPLEDKHDLSSIRDKISARMEKKMSSASGLEIKPERYLADKLYVSKKEIKSTVDLGELLNKAMSELGGEAAKIRERLESFFVFENGKVFLPVALDALLQHDRTGKAFSNLFAKFRDFSNHQTIENAAALLGRRKKPPQKTDPEAPEQDGQGGELKDEYSVKGAVFEYQSALAELLKGKLGLFRRHLLGRRLNHSARGVIVPCPELEIDRVRLPKSLFLGMLTDETKGRLQGKKEAFSDEIPSDKLNGILEDCPVWVILIRQPSLHRHNFMAFRASCWDDDVIGIPPFATPGYNADFDGDTMAVFLPPEPYAKDLSHISLLNNPGLVGTGKLALADGLDLALGWMDIYKNDKDTYKDKYDDWLEKSGKAGDKPERIEANPESSEDKPKKPEDKFVPLGDVLAGLFRKISRKDDLLTAIRELQEDVCEASTGAATMTPMDFENLYQEIHEKQDAGGFAFPKDFEYNEKETEDDLKEWVKKNHDDKSNLADFVHYKVKGGVKELRVMAAFVGKMTDYDESEKEKDRDKSEESRIESSFWEGLSDDDMFRYSYATRSSMASKKLDVAQAGYLSYLLAEGLYDTAITEKRCGAKSGMKVSWISGEGALYLSIDNKKIKFPLSGDANEENLTKTLKRIAWGREPLVKPDALLTSKDIEHIAAFWWDKKPIPEGSEDILDSEGALYLRSPLTCEHKKRRGVCAACAGADPASMPYDKPSLMEVGSRVGLTAAQAIGERGTQLAMKRFHDTGSAGNKGPVKGEGQNSIMTCKHEGRAICKACTGGGCVNESSDECERRIQNFTRIDLLKHLLISGHCVYGEELGKNSKEEGKKPDTSLERLDQLLAKVLTEDGKAFGELPQQLIHFELALMAPQGLAAWSKEAEGRWLSAFAYSGMAALEDPEKESPQGEKWSSPKSRLMWDREDGGTDE